MVRVHVGDSVPCCVQLRRVEKLKRFDADLRERNRRLFVEHAPDPAAASHGHGHARKQELAGYAGQARPLEGARGMPRHGPRSLMAEN